MNKFKKLLLFISVVVICIVPFVGGLYLINYFGVDSLVIKLICGSFIIFFELCFVRCLRKLNIIIKEFIPVLSFVFTLLGIVLAIADDYLSQYDYDTSTIHKYEDFRKNGIPFDSCISKHDITISPEYFFVLDVSESTNKLVEVSRSIQNQIDSLNASERFGTKGETFGIQNKKISLFNMLKVRLFYSLIQLSKKNFNNIDYSIIYFSEQSSIEPYTSEKNFSKRINESIDSIRNKKPAGKNTNFINLFVNLNKHLKNCPPRNQLGKKDIIIVFLTDFLHDIKDDNSYDAKKRLEKIIVSMEDANANLTLFTLNDNEGINNKNTIKIDKLLQEKLSKATYSKIDLRDYDYSFEYPITLSTPIPFFYKNSVYEDSLKTGMRFSKEQLFRFSLDNYDNNNRLDFRMSQSGRDKLHRLSNNKKDINIRKGDNINFKIFGYIPTSNILSQNIIIEDTSKGIQYAFPIAFFKTCPMTVHILLWITFIILIVSVIYEATFIILEKKDNTPKGTNRKNNSLPTNDYNININFK